MADIDPVFTLTTSGGTVLFNDASQSASGQDELRITDIPGVDAAAIRAPIDDVPFGDGALWHDFWRGARHFTVEGVMLIRSVTIGTDDVKPIRNQFEADLNAALDSIAATTADTGTLVWTPDGQSQITLTVRYEIPVSYPRQQDNYVEGFVFGLVSDGVAPSS